MTLKKMQSILTMLALAYDGDVPHGFIETSLGGEIRIAFTGQLERTAHDKMLNMGFRALQDGIYAYS